MDVKAPQDTVVPRVLVVADWAIDPHEVTAACCRRATEGQTAFALVVPAWLHGLDWVGDPYASRPCAARQLESLERLAIAAGLDVELSEVGDPNPTSAIEDARAAYPATEILICRRPHRLDHPLSLVRRVRRATRLTVREAAIRAGTVDRERHRWGILSDGGHCATDIAQAA